MPKSSKAEPDRIPQSIIETLKKSNWERDVMRRRVEPSCDIKRVQEVSETKRKDEKMQKKCREDSSSEPQDAELA